VIDRPCTPPPELAGRDDLRESVRIAIERLRRGLPTKSVLMVGLRGVGKTVLLERMRDDAEASGIHTVHIEAPEGRSLPALLAPQLRQALLRLSRNEQAKAVAKRALQALAGFAKGLKIKYDDIEVGFNYEPEPGLADNGDLEHDLQALLEAVGIAAQKAGTALLIFIDELQYVEENELAALITAMHRCAQRRVPIMLVGPRGHRQTGERPRREDRRAGARPDHLGDAGLSLLPAGVGQACPGHGRCITIRLEDVANATASAIAELDESFFRVRFDRLTPAEKNTCARWPTSGPGLIAPVTSPIA
jgi:hypothetical protein